MEDEILSVCAESHPLPSFLRPCWNTILMFLLPFTLTIIFSFQTCFSVFHPLKQKTNSDRSYFYFWTHLSFCNVLYSQDSHKSCLHMLSESPHPSLTLTIVGSCPTSYLTFCHWDHCRICVAKSSGSFSVIKILKLLLTCIISCLWNSLFSWFLWHAPILILFLPFWSFL